MFRASEPVLVAWLVGCLCFLRGISAAGAEPSAESLLQACAKSHQYCLKWKVEVDTDLNLLVEGTDEKSTKQHVKATLLRDGDRIEAHGDHVYLDAMKDQSFHFHFVTNEEVGLDTKYPLKGGAKIPKTGLVSKDLERKRSLLFAVNWFGMFMDGFLLGTKGEHIAELMRRGTELRVVKQEMMDGEPCYVVKARTQCGQATVWLATEHGCLIKKATLHKGLDDVFDAQKTFRQINDSYGPQRPDAHLKEWSGTLVNTRFEKVGDRLVPAEAVYQTTLVRANGRSYDSTFHYVRDQIDLEPVFDPAVAFKGNLPEHTPVFVEHDDSGVRYEWVKGQAVPAFADFREGGKLTQSHRHNVLLIATFATAGLLLLALSIRVFAKYRKAVA